MASSKYRPDIDGLRAVAILGVLLSHLDFKYFNGGYVGVDVFFVISGFLITRLIQSELNLSDRFSFSNFYTKRALRLLPALIFTITSTMVIGVLLLAPMYLYELAESVIFTVISLSNMYFWQNSGYFDPGASLRPLLHTWSLSVEEQFYLLWPLLLYSLYKLMKTFKVVLVLVVLGGVSLYFNKVFIDSATTIFFLTPFRIFEFILGALVVWLLDFKLKQKILYELLTFIGLVLVASPMIYFTEETVFPYLNALLPCVGTFLLIYSGKNSKIAKYVLANPLMVKTGLISYSLYLVHWPLIVFYKYYRFIEPELIEKCGLGLMSFLLAFLVYKYIEQPFRKVDRKRVSNVQIGMISVFMGMFLVLTSFLIITNDGWSERFSIPKGKLLRQQLAKTNEEYTYYVDKNIAETKAKSTFIKPINHKVKKVLVIGDSQGKDFLNIFSYSEKFRKFDVAFIRTRNSCQSYYGFTFEKVKKNIKKSWRDRCKVFHEKLNSSWAVKQADTIILTGSWNLFGAAAVEESVRNIKKVNPAVKVFIQGPKKQQFKGVAFISRYYMLSPLERLKKIPPPSLMLLRVEEILRKTKGIEDYISLYDILCDEGIKSCKVLSPEKGIIIYDNSHLTQHGAEFLYKKLERRGLWEQI